MYGVFLYMLGSFFDMVQVLLVCYIVFIYCGMLVKYIVVDKEVVQYVDYYGDKCNIEKFFYFMIKLIKSDFVW